jgi:hypothetical protein
MDTMFSWAGDRGTRAPIVNAARNLQLVDMTVTAGWRRNPCRAHGRSRYNLLNLCPSKGGHMIAASALGTGHWRPVMSPDHVGAASSHSLRIECGPAESGEPLF